MSGHGNCLVDGCEKGTYAKGYCRPHYRRLLRHGSATGVSAIFGAPRRFLEAHKSDDSEQCLPWPFARLKSGIGVIRWEARVTPAARAMCMLAHGPQPEGFETAHSCGNGHLGCVNPRHLRWATHQENIADKREHGTQLVGEQMWNAKLTESDVRNVRTRLAAGHRKADIARDYGVHPMAIRHIEIGKTWKHVT